MLFPGLNFRVLKKKSHSFERAVNPVTNPVIFFPPDYGVGYKYLNIVTFCA